MIAIGCPESESRPVLQASDLALFLEELEQVKQPVSLQVPAKERSLVLLCDVSF